MLLPTPVYPSVDEALVALKHILRGVVAGEPSQIKVLLRHSDDVLLFVLISCRGRQSLGGQLVVWRGGFVLRQFPQGFSWFGAAVAPGDELLDERFKYGQMLSYADHAARWWMAFGRCDRQIRTVEAVFVDDSVMPGQVNLGRFLIGGALRGLRELRFYAKGGRVLEAITAQGPLRDVVPLFDGPSRGTFTVQASTELRVGVTGRVEPSLQE